MAEYGTQSGKRPFAGPDDRIVWTELSDIIRNPDGGGSYIITIYYGTGQRESRTVVVAPDGSARMYTRSGLLIEKYPRDTMAMPPVDPGESTPRARLEGGATGPDSLSGADCAEAWPY